MRFSPESLQAILSEALACGQFEYLCPDRAYAQDLRRALYHRAKGLPLSFFLRENILFIQKHEEII